MKARLAVGALFLVACGSSPEGGGRDASIDVGFIDGTPDAGVDAVSAGDAGDTARAYDVLHAGDIETLPWDAATVDTGSPDIAAQEAAAPDAAADLASADAAADAMSSDAAAPDAALDLAGADAQPSLEILPLSRDWVDLHCRKPIEVKVRNGTAHASGALAVTFADLMGYVFAMTRDGCTGKSLAAGETCSIDLSLADQVISPGDGALTMRVTGQAGLAAEARLSLHAAYSESPTTLVPVSGSSADFPNTPVGSSSPAFTYRLTNAFAFVPITPSIGLSGNDSQDFVIDANDCLGRSLNWFQSCDIRIHFHPTAVGVRTTLLQAVTPAECPWTDSLPLTGHGIP